MRALPHRSLTWLSALASAAGSSGWATSAEVAAALHRTTPGTQSASTAAAGANLRRLRQVGLVDARRWNYQREWSLTRSGWAFVLSD
jgi:hypothetical protein